MSRVKKTKVENKSECALCGSHTAMLTSRKQQFAYRDGDNEVLLVADVPVWSCAACGEEYTAEGAEEAQHEAVCNYLGRLTPSSIKELRSKLGMTQAELAETTGIGIASIKRWEGGNTIQNASLDAQLRALDTPAVKPRFTARFRTVLSEDTLSREPFFKLRMQAVQFEGA